MITKKIKADLKKIISGKNNESKWPELKTYITEVIQQKPADVSTQELNTELAKEISDLILDQLSIINHPRRGSFSGIMRSKASQQTIKEFLKGINDFIQKDLVGKTDAADADFSDILRQVIINMIMSCVDKKLWKNASDILDTFNYKFILNSDELKKIRIDPYNPDLLAAVTFINKLDLGALSISAQVHSVSEYQRRLPVDNPEVKKFLTNLADIQGRVKIGLSWSLTGTAQDNLSLYGSNSIERDNFDSDIVSKHRQVVEVLDLMNNQQQTERMQYLMGLYPTVDAAIMQKILSNADRDIKQMDVFNTDINQFTNKKFLKNPDNLLIRQVVVTTEDVNNEHGMAFAFWKDKFLFFDRAGRNPGLRVYKVDDNMREIFFNLATSKSSYEIVSSQLEKAELLEYLPMQKQKRGVGNCAWIAAKGTYLISVYVNTLRLVDEQKLNVGNEHDFAAGIARSCYKYFSNQKRILDIKSYAESNFPNQDEALLAHVNLKMRTETWVKRGMTQFTTMFSKTIQDKSDSILIKKLSKSIEQADTFNFNKLFYTVINGTITVQKHCDLLATAMKSFFSNPSEADDILERRQKILEEFLSKDTTISSDDAGRLATEAMEQVDAQFKETDLFKARAEVLRAAIDKSRQPSEPRNYKDEEEKQQQSPSKQRPSFS